LGDHSPRESVDPGVSRKELVPNEDVEMIFRKTAYDCKQATLLTIKKEEGKITFIETLKLHYHFLFCDPCRRFMDQWTAINEKAKSATESLPFKLSEESKERIKRSLPL